MKSNLTFVSSDRLHLLGLGLTTVSESNNSKKKKSIYLCSTSKLAYNGKNRASLAWGQAPRTSHCMLQVAAKKDRVGTIHTKKTD